MIESAAAPATLLSPALGALAGGRGRRRPIRDGAPRRQGRERLSRRVGQAGARRLRPWPRANSRRCSVDAEPRRAEPFAFERDGGGKLTLADFKGRARAAQPVGDLVRALPGGDAGARPASGRERGPALRGGGGQCRHREARTAGGVPRWQSASRPSPATPIRAATRSRPCARTARRSACRRPSSSTRTAARSASSPAAVKWDSAEAEALVAALKGG